MLRRKNIIAFIIALITISCATVVPPNGGPIDTTPPVPLKMKPENHSKNFDKEKVVIEFDEFVVLDKLTQQMVVSPEMPEKPEVSIRGKKVIINIPDSLSENTTYTIFFGNAIINYKENLPIANFEYVFSTGDEVDSLMIEGTAVNAFDHKVPEGSFVMLYKVDDDSIPYKKRPYYLSKVEPNGHFRLNNLSAGKYKVFALKDMNSNYLFDQPTEQLAFMDSLIEPHPSPQAYLFAPRDSGDTTAVEKPPVFNPLELYFFEEAPKEQIIVESKLLKPYKFQIVFAKPLESLEMKALNLKNDTIWHFDRIGVNKDTLTSWITGVRQDTLIVQVSDNQEVLDTLRFILHKRKRSFDTPSRRKKKKKEEAVKPKPKKVVKLAYKNNAHGGFPFYADITFDFPIPIKKWDASKIKILRQRDTIVDTLNTKPYFTDPEYQMHLVIPAKFKEYKKYGIFIPDSVFFDIYGHSHDTITNMFVTTEMREYGAMKLTINYPENEPLIVQLLDEKDKVVFQDIITKSGLIDYPYLKPGNYRIKAIADANKNGKWDTGDYLKKLQPEKTYFIKDLINVRANWDVAQEWIIE
jgi:hypothetical protein